MLPNFECPSTKTELIVCALDPVLVSELAEEMVDPGTIEIRNHVGFRDESVASLTCLLEKEGNSGGLAGGLYVDHLTCALTVRLLSLGNKIDDAKKVTNKLPDHILRRVVDRMEADLSNTLDLKTLAVESGYSRNHFLRMFRAATGYTPHRYLLRLRVKRAQALMKNKSMRLIDVALACGFSSHAHLSHAFRQLVGATPSEYRRNILMVLGQRTGK
jgi:AraC family transcriptional regulator